MCIQGPKPLKLPLVMTADYLNEKLQTLMWGVYIWAFQKHTTLQDSYLRKIKIE